MASEQDHYAVLQVHPEAHPEVISAAYRRLAQLYYNPDRNAPPETGKRMAQISMAYEVLRDPMRRADYDLRRAEAERQAEDLRRQAEAESWAANYPGEYSGYEERERIIIVEKERGCGGQLLGCIIWFVIGFIVLSLFVSVCTPAAVG